MREREVGGLRLQQGTRRAETASMEVVEALLERAVGGGNPTPVVVPASELRPQQSRNGVWRWQMRRRRRED